jgi:hypothetical protein
MSIEDIMHEFLQKTGITRYTAGGTSEKFINHQRCSSWSSPKLRPSLFRETIPLYVLHMHYTDPKLGIPNFFVRKLQA